MRILNCAAAAALMLAAGQASAATFVVNQTADITGLGLLSSEGFQIGHPHQENDRFSPDVAVTMIEGDVLDWTVMFTGGYGYLHATGPVSFAARLTTTGDDSAAVQTSGTLSFLDGVGNSFASAFTSGSVQGMGSNYLDTDFAAVVPDTKIFGFHYVGTLDDLPDETSQMTFRYGFAFITGASAVPEPATWAMMISGFAMAGMALRRRRTTVA